MLQILLFYSRDFFFFCPNESILGFLKKIFFFLFIYFWLHSVFVAVHGLSLVVKHRILIAVASFVVQHGL